MQLDVDKNLLKSLLVMADIIEARDPYTGGHVWRVSNFAKALAIEFGLSNDDTILAGIGGYLHDLGKVGISDSILKKKERLNDDEFETIKTHPTIGASLVREHPLSMLALDVIQNHHERLDGKGYPLGLDGDDLSLFAQIVNLADSFDALTSVRPYHAGVSIEEAISILSKAVETQFDAKLFAALESLNRESRLSHIVGHCDDGIPLISCAACGPVITVNRHTQNGDIAFCRVCAGKNALHAKQDTFEAEWIGTLGAPSDLQVGANMEIINDLAAQIPRQLNAG